MNIGKAQTQASVSYRPQQSVERSPLKEAVVHIGREVSQEAIIGVAYAGTVMVGDSLGLGSLARAGVGLVGGLRGLHKYSETATAALDSQVGGKALAFTLGASTALLAGMSGNVLTGAAVGAGLGLVQAPKSYAGSN